MLRRSQRTLLSFVFAGCLLVCGLAAGAGVSLTSTERGNLFDSETGVMTLTVDDASNASSIQVDLLDEYGVTVGTLQLEPTASQTFTLPARGYYEIRAKVVYKDGTEANAAASAAVVGPQLPKEVWWNSPFGHGGSQEIGRKAGGCWSRLFHSLCGEDATRAIAEGIPEDNKPTWGDRSDEMNFIFGFWPQPPTMQDRPADDPPWTFAQNHQCYPIKEEMRDDYQRLVRWAIRDLSVKPEVVTVWNEPPWHGTMEQMVDFVKLYTEAVHQELPDACVIGPCHCDINMHELRRYADAGLFDVLDGVDMHAYVQATPPEGEFISLVRQLKQFLKDIGHGDMPIYFTEFGWCVPPGDWQTPVDPITQARYCVRSQVLLATEGIDGWCYFCLCWADPNASANTYGLLDAYYMPRPAYAAFSTMTRELANITKQSRILMLTPTTYMVVFPKPDGTATAVVYDTERELEIPLPANATSVRAMCGRAIPLEGRRSLTVSPSPVYIQMSDTSWVDEPLAEPVTLQLDETREMGFKPLFAAPVLQPNGTSLTPERTAALGDYILFVEDASSPLGFRLHPVKVIAPAIIRAVRLDWPHDAVQPGLFGTVLSFIDESQVYFLSTPGLGKDSIVHVQGHAEEPFWHAIPEAKPGVRYRGEMALKDGKGRNVQARAYDFTILPISPRGTADVTRIDLGAWADSGEMAWMTLEYAEDGLYIEVDYADESHVQTKKPGDIWTEDSIQIALDMDADTPFQANHGGYQGHFRVFEYGFALKDGAPIVYRWLSFYDALPENSEENRVQADIAHDEEAKMTRYRLMIPWAALGLEKAPDVHSSMGIAVTINDRDAERGGRSTLNFFDGIVTSKDPRLYGRAYFK